jgi:hypothetical protein
MHHAPLTDGNYGVSSAVYAPTDNSNACQSCPSTMTTLDTWSALTTAQRSGIVNGGSSSCVTAPGYGYNSGTNTAS